MIIIFAQFLPYGNSALEIHNLRKSGFVTIKSMFVNEIRKFG
jgi:hypothetical protein